MSAVRRKYTVAKDGQEWEVWANSEPPSWLRDALRTGVGAGRMTVEVTQRIGSKKPPTGPNYDRTANSVRAAILYEPKRSNNRHRVLIYLLRNTHRWVTVPELRANGGGDDPTRRVRELDKQGWTIARHEPPGKSKETWGYCMDLTPEATDMARSMLRGQ